MSRKKQITFEEYLETHHSIESIKKFPLILYKPGQEVKIYGILINSDRHVIYNGMTLIFHTYRCYLNGGGSESDIQIMDTEKFLRFYYDFIVKI